MDCSNQEIYNRLWCNTVAPYICVTSFVWIFIPRTYLPHWCDFQTNTDSVSILITFSTLLTWYMLLYLYLRKELILPGHCLHQLLPCEKTVDVLRPRGYNFTLPKCKYDVYKGSFFNCCLCSFKRFLVLVILFSSTNTCFSVFIFILSVKRAFSFLIKFILS
jgi:hypothetical protein